MEMGQLINNSLLLLSLIKDHNAKGRQSNESLFKTISLICKIDPNILRLSLTTFQIIKNLFLMPHLNFYTYIKLSEIEIELSNKKRPQRSNNTFK